MRQKCKQKVHGKEIIILIVKSTQPVIPSTTSIFWNIALLFSRSDNQLNASEYFFVSSHLRILKGAHDNTLFQQSFERIIGLFATLSFQHHN